MGENFHESTLNFFIDWLLSDPVQDADCGNLSHLFDENSKSASRIAPAG